MRPMTEWFEKADFWDLFEPFLFTHIRTTAMTAHETAGAAALLDLKAGDSVLDMPCGIGRHTVELARRGCRLTGVDLTRNYLKKTGARAKAAGVAVELVRDDMRRFRRENGFDAAINMFSSFGYFADPRHDRETLANYFESLKPGGRLLLDLLGREILKRNFREQTEYKDEETGAYLVHYSRITRRWDWIENHWTWVLGRRQREFKFGIRVYSAEEIERLLLETGFAVVDLFGTFDGGPYGASAERLIAVGTKEA